MREKILITGGMGFIGSHLISALYLKGYRNLVVLDNLSKQVHGQNPRSGNAFANITEKVEFLEGSVTNREDLTQALHGVNIVVHLAAETGTGQSMYEIKRYSDVNIGGTALLLDILANSKSHDVKKIVVASSRSIYGEGKYWSADMNQFVYPEHRQAEHLDKGDFEVAYGLERLRLQLTATDEESKIHPSSVYGITKQNQEQMIMTVCPTIGISPVAFRYQNVYGAGQSLSNPYTGILSIFSNLILNNKSINVFEDGLESRDFVYVEDVVKATICGIENERANGEIFNVGYGQPTSVLEVVDTLMKSYNTDVPIYVSGNYRLGDIRYNYADLKKISSTLGFVPQISFKGGISKFCQWVVNQNISEDNSYEKSILEMREKGLFK